jgi:adenosylmethionine-8-amino-7-oxononanoate aminotransferase
MVESYDTEAIRQSSLQYQWMHNQDWTQMAEEGRPNVMVEGHGLRVTDSTGKTWLDVNGGYLSVHVGYGRHEIAYAAYEQLKKITFFPMGTTTPPVIELCEKLAEITPGGLSRSYLSTGGSEANETAIKIAKAYHKRRGDSERYKIISRKGAYHGTTGVTMWLGDNLTENGLSDFEPGYPGILHAAQPYPYRCELGGKSPSECAELCAQSVEDVILREGPKSVAAFIGEPVFHRRGAIVPGDEYWPMVRDICDRYGVLMIVDEVVCGFGRTGKMFGIDHWDVVPDIMTMAKGLTSSYIPVSAAVVSDEVADHFVGEGNVFNQAITGSGHPVAAATALKNIEIIENENLVERSAEMGAYFKDQLEHLMDSHVSIGEVRGIGLLLAVELVSDRETKVPFPKEAELSKRLSATFQERGLLLRGGANEIMLSPPLCITRDEVNEIVSGIDAALGGFEQGLGIN